MMIRSMAESPWWLPVAEVIDGDWPSEAARPSAAASPSAPWLGNSNGLILRRYEWEYMLTCAKNVMIVGLELGSPKRNICSGRSLGSSSYCCFRVSWSGLTLPSLGCLGLRPRFHLLKNIHTDFQRASVAIMISAFWSMAWSCASDMVVVYVVFMSAMRRLSSTRLLISVKPTNRNVTSRHESSSGGQYSSYATSPTMVRNRVRMELPKVQNGHGSLSPRPSGLSER
mmetsp:Transcript_6225/g.16052  ORF Transcript_6225/g.16052 Transcript_6225/m.16052 type:complete len:227 (-) Transcript_6225:2253-2933(-)